MPDITFEQLTLMAALILSGVAAYNAVSTARRNHHEERKRRETPVTALAGRVDRHDTLLDRDKRRMDELDARIGRIDTQSTIMLRGVRALLSHQVNGNSVDRLESSLAEIDNYLIERK